MTRALRSEEILPLVYDELKRLARSRMSGEGGYQTLQATALVHEAYLRLTSGRGAAQWASKRHFFAVAAEAMRWILIDHARARQSAKRGGDLRRVELRDVHSVVSESDDTFALSEVVERFEAVDPVAAEIVKLRYFVGMTVDEVAELCGMSPRTVKRHWSYARAWIRDALGTSGASGGD